jgi:PAS domain S-box-containing protein
VATALTTADARPGDIVGSDPVFRFLARGHVWVELTVSVIRDEHGRPLRGMGLVQDITERRRALADAQTELAHLARDRDRILEFAGEGIYHVDERGRITFANPAAAQMLGWTPDELLGKPAEELLDHTRADGTHYLSRRDGRASRSISAALPSVPTARRVQLEVTPLGVSKLITWTSPSARGLMRSS